MDIKRIILGEGIFDSQADIYPLHIIPTGMYGYGAAPVGATKTFSGIHFVGTSTLLSIREDAPIAITAQFDEEGNSLPPDDEDVPAIHFESIEIGTWCELVAHIGSSDVLEHCDIPFLFRAPDFEDFERLASGMVTKRTVSHCYDRALQSASDMISPRYDPSYKLQQAFYSYYDVLQGIVIAGSGRLVHEADFLTTVAPQISTLYPLVLEKVKKQQPLSRYELAKIEEEVKILVEQGAELAGDSELPDEPPERLIKSLDQQLLRLRRAIF